jgi:hypothetical protein
MPTIEKDKKIVKAAQYCFQRTDCSNFIFESGPDAALASPKKKESASPKKKESASPKKKESASL